MTGPSSDPAKPELSRQGELWRGTFSAMAGPCEVLMDGLGEREARASLQVASAQAWRIEAHYSRYQPESVVSRINSSAGEAVEVDEECARLLDFADHLHRISEGAFDITSGVLRRAWTFDGGDRVPSRETVQALLAFVGWDQVRWDPPTIQLPRGMEIDLGGIGKEYAVDRVAEELSDRFGGSFLVNFGGDLRVTGPRSDGSPWTAAIESPGRDREGIEEIRIHRGGLATSGDARRFVLHQGRRYGHILDPRTGWPVAGAPRSVTVLAATCVEAGLLATLAILQGKNAARFLDDNHARSWVVSSADLA
jgi:thiamine biosynthesis lipoprotein